MKKINFSIKNKKMNLGKSSKKDLKDKENTAPSNIQVDDNSTANHSIRNKKHFQ